MTYPVTTVVNQTRGRPHLATRLIEVLDQLTDSGTRLLEKADSAAGGRSQPLSTPS